MLSIIFLSTGAWSGFHQSGVEKGGGGFQKDEVGAGGQVLDVDVLVWSPGRAGCARQGHQDQHQASQ